MGTGLLADLLLLIKYVRSDTPIDGRNDTIGTVDEHLLVIDLHLHAILIATNCLIDAVVESCASFCQRTVITVRAGTLKDEGVPLVAVEVAGTVVQIRIVTISHTSEVCRDHATLGLLCDASPGEGIAPIPYRTCEAVCLLQTSTVFLLSLHSTSPYKVTGASEHSRGEVHNSLNEWKRVTAPIHRSDKKRWRRSDQKNRPNPLTAPLPTTIFSYYPFVSEYPPSSRGTTRYLYRDHVALSTHPVVFTFIQGLEIQMVMSIPESSKTFSNIDLTIFQYRPS
ncbi:hypothetical protein J6590_041568 [Homalodisca vitripennis]|nr:hypothetical protein J6590_041568 [Homalodisca vitripennis]